MKRRNERQGIHAIRALFSVILSFVLCFGTAAPMAAFAGSNANGTQVDLSIQTGDISDSYVKVGELPTPNSIPAKDITKPLNFKLTVVYAEPTDTGKSITLKIPRYATFTLGTDASTGAAVAGTPTIIEGDTASDPTAPSTVTIPLKDGDLGNMFEIYYSVAYNQKQTINNLATNFTPSLFVNDAFAVEGDTLNVTTACGMKIWPSLRYATDGGFTYANAVNFMDQYNGPNGMKQPYPTQLASVGSSYSLKMQAMPQFLNDSHNQTLSSVFSAMTPKTIEMSFLLPKEALVTSLGPGITQTTEGDRIRLTAIPPEKLDMNGYSYMLGYMNNFPKFTVRYTDVPANGTSFVYDMQISGTWWDDTPFTVTETANHIYTPIPPSGPVLGILYTAMSVDTWGNNIPGSFRGGAWSLRGSDPQYVAIGDPQNFAYGFQNTGDQDAKDLTFTLPIDGNAWEVTQFALGQNLISPLAAATGTEAGKPFKKMIVTYSDGSKKTLDFNDSSVFMSNMFVYKPGSGIYTRCSQPAFADLVNNSADTPGAYPTSIDITVDTMNVGQSIEFGLRVKLRETGVDGTPIQPGTTYPVKSTISGYSAVDSSPAEPATKTSSAYTYCSPETEQIGLGMRLAISSSATLPQYAAGTTIPMTANFSMRDPVSYRAIMKDPSFHIVVPGDLFVDTSSISLMMGGTAQTTIPATDYYIEDMRHDDVNNVNIYTIRYSGEMVYRDLYEISASYNVVIPKSAPAKSVDVFAMISCPSEQDAIGAGQFLDIWDIDEDGLTNDWVAGAKNTFTVYAPAGISVAASSQGNLDGATTWYEGGPLATIPGTSLGRAQTTGTIRTTLINNTDQSLSAGMIYTKKPVGDFIPTLTGVNVTTTDILTPGATPTTINPTMFYTLNTAADMKSIPTGEWVAFTDPATVPANAAAFMVDVTSLGQYLRADVAYTYSVPSSATKDQAVTATSQVSVNSGATPYSFNTSYVGIRAIRPTYQVNYYKDAISGAPFQQSQEFATTPGTAITLDTGTTEGQTNWNRPTGYKAGVQTPVPSALTGDEKTTINVLFEKDTYTLSFNANGGSPTPASQPLLFGTKATAVADPTKTNFTFGGWYTDDGTFANKWDFATSTMPGQNITLYAKWIPDTYTLSFNAKGGSPTPASQVIAVGALSAEPTATPLKTGHTSGGWYTDDGTFLNQWNFATSTMPAADTTLYLKWVPNPHTLSFNTNGGSTAPVNQTVNYGALASEPTTPTKAGYDFKGWYSDNSTFAIRWDFANTTMPDTDVTLYAKWALASDYSITYDLAGGAIPNSGSNPTSYNIESSAITLLNPEREGYTFAGWTGTGITGSSTSVTIPTGSTGNRSYVATWTINQRTLSFNANGGSPTPSNQTINYGSLASEPATPTKAGYDFSGWFKDNTTFLNQWNFATSTMPDSNVTLFAKWVLAGDYSITYDLAGGAIPNSGSNPTSYNIESSSITLLNPEREGYTFAGWTGTGITGSSTSVTIPTGSTGNRSYVATWTARTDIPLTVKYYKESLPLSPLSVFAPLADETYIDSASISVTFGAGVDLSTIVSGPGSLNYKKPTTGYQDGVQVDTPYTVSAISGNEIKVLYSRKTDLSYVVKYYSGSTSGTLLYTSDPVTGLKYGDWVTLENHIVSAFQMVDGTHRTGLGYQVGTSTMIDDVEPNIINVIYPLNTPPVVEATEVIHLKKNVVLTQKQFLELVGATASDVEDGTYDLEDIQIENWSNILFGVVNYPGTPYTVRLSVTDSDGATSDIKTVAVFVDEDPVTPDGKTPAPAGYVWVRDANGTYSLSPKTADSNAGLAITFTALLGAMAAMPFLLRRRKRETLG